jgi:UDP-glucose 4-epimerase
VTGGAGFIGANTCNILSTKGYRVIAMDNLALGDKANLDPSVTFVDGDLTADGALDRVGPVDYVIHLAGSSSSPMFITDLQGSVVNNIVGHLKVLEFARRVKARKILFASTSSIYGNNPIPLLEDQSVAPPNFYAVSKHCMEELSRVYQSAHGMDIIGFRFMSVYGLHEEHKGRFANIVSQFIWGIEQGKEPVVYGDGTQRRDLTHVRDIVDAFLLAIHTERRLGFRIYRARGRHAGAHRLDQFRHGHRRAAALRAESRGAGLCDAATGRPVEGRPGARLPAKDLP